jgi:hypothetical protein
MEARRSETEVDAPGRGLPGRDTVAATRDPSAGAATTAIDAGPGPKDLTFGGGILGLTALAAIALGIILSVT